MKYFLRPIHSDFEAFAQLTELHAQVRDSFFQTLEIDMGGATWFDANMCAPFGAILYKTSRNLNTVKLESLTPKVKSILSKNGFLMNYGVAKSVDVYGTTIEYKRFEAKDERYFAAYIEQHLVGKGMPKMSVGLKKNSEKAFLRYSATPLSTLKRKWGFLHVVSSSR